MNNESRIKNSIRNSGFGVFTQIATIAINFLVRSFFIAYLSIEYLGLNGLFTNILIMLSLAELGIGGAIIYSMYKPAAENDFKKLAALMGFYKTVYFRIGLLILALGLVLIPFLQYIVNSTLDNKHVILIYLLYLLNTTISYFFIYKSSIIRVHQQEYILSLYKLIFNVLKASLQLFIIVKYQSFIGYLIIQIISTFFENYLISLHANRKYPFILLKEKLDNQEKKTIWTNIKALMIYKVGSTVMDGIDNIVISAFLTLSLVGYLSNYTLIIGSLMMVTGKVISAITASVGNFVAKESEEKNEKLLSNLTYLNFLIFGFSFIALNTLLNPFIEIWLGNDFKLSYLEVFVLSLNFYVYSMMNSIWMFRSTMGLFIYGRYRPLYSAAINLILSIALVSYIGLVGVLLATTISRLITNVWFDPLIVYKYGLKKSPKEYYEKWIKYFLVTLFGIFILNYISMFFIDFTILKFSILMVITLITSIFILTIFTYKTDEFLYFRGLLLKMTSKNY